MDFQPLLVISGWERIASHSIPFGIMHSPTPSPTVQRFLDVARVVSKGMYT